MIPILQRCSKMLSREFVNNQNRRFVYRTLFLTKFQFHKHHHVCISPREYITTCEYYHVCRFPRVYITTCVYSQVYITTCVYYHVCILPRVYITTCVYYHVCMFPGLSNPTCLPRISIRIVGFDSLSQIPVGIIRFHVLRNVVRVHRFDVSQFTVRIQGLGGSIWVTLQFLKIHSSLFLHRYWSVASTLTRIRLFGDVNLEVVSWFRCSNFLWFVSIKIPCSFENTFDWFVLVKPSYSGSSSVTGIGIPFRELPTMAWRAVNTGLGYIEAVLCRHRPVNKDINT